MKRTILILVIIIPACALLLSCAAPAHDKPQDEPEHVYQSSAITCTIAGKDRLIPLKPGQEPTEVCPQENIRFIKFQPELTPTPPVPGAPDR